MFWKKTEQDLIKMDKTDRILKSLQPRPEIKTPIATDMFLPNMSAVQTADGKLKGDGSALTGITAAPVGTIVMYGGSDISPPDGWFICNGYAANRTTYAALFAVISTTFGTGDGSTTFNVPDMRGIFPRGAGTSAKLSNANSVAFAGTLGTYQNDSFQGHRPRLMAPASATGGAYEWSIYPFQKSEQGWQTLTASNPAYQGDLLTDGTNGVPRTGAETNPANLGLNFIIKY